MAVAAVAAFFARRMVLAPVATVVAAAAAAAELLAVINRLAGGWAAGKAAPIQAGRAIAARAEAAGGFVKGLARWPFCCRCAGSSVQSVACFCVCGVWGRTEAVGVNGCLPVFVACLCDGLLGYAGR